MQKTALMAVLHLENATIAERALTEFFQMCRLQDLLEGGLKVKVGFMEKKKYLGGCDLSLIFMHILMALKTSP